MNSIEIAERLIKNNGFCDIPSSCEACPCKNGVGTEEQSGMWGCGWSEVEKYRIARVKTCREFIEKTIKSDSYKLEIALSALQKIAVLADEESEYMRAKLAVDISRDALRMINL